MTTILSIESSGNICSIALHIQEELIDIIESTEPNSHSEKLALFIREIMQRNHFKITDLSAIAVSEGPGSYTGLRIGVSMAKGLCYASGIPLIAVDTLKSLALAMTLKKPELPENTILIPMIDARRMEVYSAEFDLQLNKVSETKPIILDDYFNKTLEPKFNYIAAGSGAAKLNSIPLSENVSILENITFSAKYIGNLAFKKFVEKRFADIAYFEPLYLKEFAVLLKKE